MNIGFDAKRNFHNGTGLGNYSRTLIAGLTQFYPQHQYFLFNPKPSDRFQKPALDNVHEVLPQSFLSKKFSSLWRSNWMTNDLKKNKIQLYHGLTNEIPVGIAATGIPSAVTIHDIIFEFYPEQYKKLDVAIYRKKFKYACAHADAVIAISKQTKKDLIEQYGVDENKIHICYQSCSPAFAERISEEEKENIRRRFSLPQQFFLYVGSIIERKNLLNICQAMQQLKNEVNIPLVVIGDGKKYKQEVKHFVQQNSLEQRVIFLSDSAAANKDTSFTAGRTFATIYQMATAMIYPSFYEGFGIPVLEALWSRLPVITSNVSCLPETGGEGAYYVNPANAEEIAAGMKKIVKDKEFAQQMIEKGWQHAQNFTLEKCTASVMDVYKKIFNATV